MTEIYLAKNHLLLAAGYGNMEMHSHSASHVLVGLHGKMRVVTDEEEITCRGAILPSGIVRAIWYSGNCSVPICRLQKAHPLRPLRRSLTAGRHWKTAAS